MCFEKLQIEFTRQGLRAFRVDPASSRQNIIISQIFVKIALTGFFLLHISDKMWNGKRRPDDGGTVGLCIYFLEDLLAHASC